MIAVAVVHVPKECDDGERNMEKRQEDVLEKEARGGMRGQVEERWKNAA